MKILEVAEVGQYIKDLLDEDDLLADLWITGELTNVSRSGAGHYYFALRDESGQIRSVLFRGAALRCGAEPKAGDAVVAHGRIAFYQPTGACEFCVDLLYPSGVGLAQLRFEELRLKLEQEGLFAPERKRSLPELPRRIGLVTSQGGAVLHDVLNVLSRRFPLAEVVFAHSAVQGEHAPPEIVAALDRLRAWRGDNGLGVDVVIVGRGGGSPEELASFNDERVARAIFASPWPVISAVGHETDVTICDLVADLRAPTPSAAAELVAPSILTLAQEVGELVGRARLAMEAVLASHRSELERARSRVLAQSPAARIARSRQDVRHEVSKARLLVERQLRTASETLAGRQLQLQALSPLATLGRGYSIVSVEDGRGPAVARSVEQVTAGARLSIEMIDGSVEATAADARPVDRRPLIRSTNGA
jgi:exodeoxyribonuclease VII large subunit